MDSFQKFHQWIENNGGQMGSCEVSRSKWGRGLGLFATDKESLAVTTENEKVLLSIPLHLTITSMAVIGHPESGDWYRQVVEDGGVDERSLIMLLLVVERMRGAESFWAPYLNLLPSHVSSTLSFKKEEVEELAGTPLYKATKLKLKSFQELYNTTLKDAAETLLMQFGIKSCVTFDDFIWAHTIFWSRALSIPLPPSEESAAGGQVEGEGGEGGVEWVEGLVPGLDFANHDPSPCVRWEVGDVSISPDSILLITGPDVNITPTSEICISYGQKGNEELLFLYGFALEGNTSDTLMINFSQQKLIADPLSDPKTVFLQAQNLPLAHHLHESTPPPPKKSSVLPLSESTEGRDVETVCSLEVDLRRSDAVSAMRVLAMKSEQIEEVVAWLSEGRDPDMNEDPNPEAVRSAVLHTCGDLEALYLLKHLLNTRLREMVGASGSEDADALLIQTHRGAVGEGGGDKTSCVGAALAHESHACKLSYVQWACIVYRHSQKRLVRRFIEKVDETLLECSIPSQVER